MNHRGRITITDLLLFLASFAFMAIMWPLMMQVLNQQDAALGTGEHYIWMLVIPLGIVTLFLAFYRTAIAGVGP